MAGQRKTSSRVAKVASSLMRNGHTSKPAKTVSASALSQRAPKPSTRRKK